jgi:hypothetical protein
LIFPGIAALVLFAQAHAQDLTVDQSSTDQTTKIEAHLEKRYTVDLELTPPVSRLCKSSVSIGFLQKNAIASVETTVQNSDCDASEGSYVMAIRIRDASGTSQELEFEETWQRDDALPIIGMQEYDIGDNVDLVRVRTKKLRCTCTDPVAADEE